MLYRLASHHVRKFWEANSLLFSFRGYHYNGIQGGLLHMGDIFVVTLTALIVVYAYYDEIFTE
ncbi:MAG: hypothetical protein IJT82_05080 [Schwartzia sp.]|nr:hypothetical protein [Schwartzia sp. (in: firmicutes)]